jgi:hypothetical protein
LLGGVRSSASTAGKSVGGADTLVDDAPQADDDRPMPESPADGTTLPDIAE